MDSFPLEPLGNGDDGDRFDWWERALAEAGIESTSRDLSHLPLKESFALIRVEEAAAIDLARAAGIPKERDLFNHDQPRGLSPEMQRRLLDTVGGVTVPHEAFARMMAVTDIVPEEFKKEGPTCAHTATECVEILGLTEPGMALALLARSIALRHWRAEHDPEGMADKQAQIAAGARAPVIIVDGTPAFDGPGFTDLIAFVNDLPW
jgi:hypothetical protein